MTNSLEYSGHRTVYPTNFSFKKNSYILQKVCVSELH
jgi:hypothetical protein